MYMYTYMIYTYMYTHIYVYIYNFLGQCYRVAYDAHLAQDLGGLADQPSYPAKPVTPATLLHSYDVQHQHVHPVENPKLLVMMLDHVLAVLLVVVETPVSTPPKRRECPKFNFWQKNPFSFQIAVFLKYVYFLA